MLPGDYWVLGLIAFLTVGVSPLVGLYRLFVFFVCYPIWREQFTDAGRKAMRTAVFE